MRFSFANVTLTLAAAGTIGTMVYVHRNQTQERQVRPMFSPGAVELHTSRLCCLRRPCTAPLFRTFSASNESWR
jgi:hypothetical protein